VLSAFTSSILLTSKYFIFPSWVHMLLSKMTYALKVSTL
jgi:hypothetical protein